MSGYSN
jgi:pre-mRNA-processing factor SLU7